MDFTFIHAADLHIDSPLDTLGGKDAIVAAQFRAAGRAAFTTLVDEAIWSKAAFLIIAGDVFDEEWRDIATGMFFAGQLRRLSQAGIAVYIIKGNHDAESVVTRQLPEVPGVEVFSSRKAHTHHVQALNVALHGRSYPHRQPPEGFVDSYPAPVPGALNIGLLHTGLEGGRGEHAAYAPCTVAQLQSFGYDYWALGHIHQREIVSTAPWIVYPGNIQGRSIRETGSKGAMRVSVANGRIASVEPLVLDKARWAHHQIDVSGCASQADIEHEMALAMASASDEAGQLPVALRLTLHGSSAWHAVLAAGHAGMVERARLGAASLAADLWVEQVRLETVALPDSKALGPVDSLDIATLLDAAMQDGDLSAALAADIALIAAKFPKTSLMDLATDPNQLARQARDILIGKLKSSVGDLA